MGTLIESVRIGSDTMEPDEVAEHISSLLGIQIDERESEWLGIYYWGKKEECEITVMQNYNELEPIDDEIAWELPIDKKSSVVIRLEGRGLNYGHILRDIVNYAVSRSRIIKIDREIPGGKTEN